MEIVVQLTSDQRMQLAELLRRCVVQVQVGPEKGTGFFIAPGQVLTCRHVVASAIAPRAGQISVRWWRDKDSGPQVLNATLLEEPPPDWPDIAILSVPGAVDCPCVILDASTVDVDTRLLTAGYPLNAEILFQPQEFTAGYLAHDEANKNALRFSGDIVKDGMSGSPIISVTYGLVVGIVRMTKGGGPLGGFGTLLADIVESVPSLQPLADRPPTAAREWLGILSFLQLKDAERNRETGARNVQKSLLPRIDLIVEQSDSQGNWQIAVRATRGHHPERRFRRAAGDLGNDVIRAVDGWSRHQMIRQKEDLRILGSVLDRALLPVEAKTAVDEDLKVPPLLLRVCADNAGSLSRLPWEYACGDDAEPLSVDRRIVFARFVDVPSDPPAPKDRLRVLAVIEMPGREAPKFLGGYPNEIGEIIHPDADEFLKSIKNYLSGNPRIHFDYVSNGTIEKVMNKLGERWDIVHYIGFAWNYTEPVISLGSGQDGELTPARISDLADYLALSKCPVFVAQFHRLEPRSTLPAIADLDAFTPLLNGDLQAIIVTRFPVDIVDFRKFNASFYGSISNGDCVEAAVQLGRSAVKKRIGQDGVDALAFGSFTVTTRRASEIRLLTPLQAAGSGAQEPPSVGQQRAESGAGPGPAPEDTASVSTASWPGA